jgi:hypothetical protein
MKALFIMIVAVWVGFLPAITMQAYADCVVGDLTNNIIIGIPDAIVLIQYIFNGGPAPDPLARGDCNCDGIPNIADVVYLIRYIFEGGPTPGDPNGDLVSDCNCGV